MRFKSLTDTDKLRVFREFAAAMVDKDWERYDELGRLYPDYVTKMQELVEWHNSVSPFQPDA